MLQYRVAARLGMTVAELRGRMSAAELAGWAAFFRIEEGAPPLRDGATAALTQAPAEGPRKPTLAEKARLWLGLMPKTGAKAK